MKFIRVRILIPEKPAQESWVIDLSLMDWSAKMNVVTLVVEITSRESSKSLENLRNERFASSRLMFKKSWSKNIEFQEFWPILKILNPLIVMTMLLKILVISSIVNPQKNHVRKIQKQSFSKLQKLSKSVQGARRTVCLDFAKKGTVGPIKIKNCYVI